MASFKIPEWYCTWAAYHAAQFAFTEADQKAILAWGPQWSVMFAAEDLYDATATMAADENTPRWAADQRGLILRHAKTRRGRAVREEAQQRAMGRKPNCELCGGSGWVIVPHPGLDSDNQMNPHLHMPSTDAFSRLLEGSSVTMGVCCLCEDGVRTRNGLEGRNKSPLCLDVYEARYPNWRTVAAAIGRVVNDPPEPPDAADVQRLVNEVAQQMKMKPPRPTLYQPGSVN